eukprot:Opistho-2@17827
MVVFAENRVIVSGEQPVKEWEELSVAPSEASIVAPDRLASERKKKSSPRLRRDSLNSRLNPGFEGSRRYRRWENLCFLLDNAGEIDEYKDVILPNKSRSYFASLFEDEAKLKTWLSFLEASEEAQLSIAAIGTHSKKAVPKESDFCMEPSSPADCFGRIERHIRDALRCTNVPKGLLEYMEKELVDAFMTSSQFVLVWMLGSSYDRLLAHGLCQYYSLVSRSEDTDQGRQTIIENPNDFFTVPEAPLCAFLAKSHS